MVRLMDAPYQEPPPEKKQLSAVLPVSAAFRERCGASRATFDPPGRFCLDIYLCPRNGRPRLFPGDFSGSAGSVMRDGFSTASVDALEPPVLVAPAICGTEFG